jgi:transposase
MSAVDATEARRQRGLAIAAVTKIEQKKGGLWTVPSQTGNGRYWVRPDADQPRCTCKDFEIRGQPCKHIYAVQYVIERESHPDGSETVTETLTVAKRTVAHRPTYKQVWPAYDKAQTTEKRHVQALLADLCRGVQEPPRKPGRGRRPIPMADQVFSAVFKVYCTLSSRRFISDLAAACEKGYITKVPHFTSVCAALESPELTPLLRALIAESARPLRSIEIDFAVDSSGFTTSRFVRWFDHKYGVVKKEYDWVKVSVMTGVKTNVITAVEIDERYAGDSPKFAPLVNATAQAFAINEVSADAAYLSYENMDLVTQLGGTPYIAFKANTTAAQGGTFDKMFHLYNLNRDDYLSHYHKRSNVETTFSMIKAKFGDHLLSKTDTAMINEALCKILCHNLCCLVQSAYELSIAATFWGEDAIEPTEPEPTPDVDELIGMLAWV